MKANRHWFPGLIALCLLSACSTQWTRLDGSATSEVELQQAMNVCQVNEKMAQLEQAEADRSADFAQAKSNADKMLARENFDQASKRINAEIEDCMLDRGLKRGL